VPRISAFYGIAIYMYYRDHAPPHFHAIYGEYEATVSIETAEVLEGQLPRRARTLVSEWAAAHRDELEELEMILRIREARVCGSHSLRLTFNDGTTKQVDVRPLLDGPIFEPLRDPAYFAYVTLDSICGTVVWPNGADFAPEALQELEAEKMSETAA
jgi:Domain of unknown function (DUF4160)/Protein of unknown function (DUF2442)